MSVVEMSKLTFIGLQEDKLAITEELMKIGLIEVDESYEIPGEMEGLLKSINNTEEIIEIDRNLEKLETVLSKLSAYDKRKKSLFSSRRTVTAKEYEDIRNRSSSLMRVVDFILEAEKSNSQYSSEINRLRNSINNLLPWRELGIPWEVDRTKHTCIIKGVMPSENDFDEVRRILYASVKESCIELLHDDGEQKYMLLIIHADFESKALEIMKKFNFSRVTYKELTGTTADNINRINVKIKELELKQQQEARKVIVDHVRYISELEMLYDSFRIIKEREEAIKKLRGTSRIFILRGWLPSKAAEKVKTAMTSTYTCIFELEKPGEDEQFPVLLDNKGLAESVEMVTEMYSLPDPREIDPNAVMAPFFVLFFGLMLSDAGYGLILALSSGFILWKFRLEKSQKKFLKLMFYCGLATVFWGSLFGSWFGNLVYTVSYGKYSINPLWFDPVAEPEKLLTWSLAFGVVHIYVGIAVKAANLIRQKKYVDAVFDALFWYILFTGAIFSVLSYVPGINTENIEGLGEIGKYLLIVGAVLLILTQGRSKKNPVSKFFSGIGSLYDLVSFMSDVLSYSRLLALGLATSVIGSIINQMGAMMGLNNLFGIFVFALVFVFGHVFNFLINALGAYVHSSRLQYIEFFGKFYKGGGKAFTPLKINTKYTIIENDKEDYLNE